MEKVTLEYFRNNLTEIFERVQKGHSLIITDNGHTLARLTPMKKSSGGDKNKFPKFIKTKEEFDTAMARIDELYEKGELSIEDCYLSRVEPVDMGYTDSSNLDAELYK